LSTACVMMFVAAGLLWLNVSNDKCFNTTGWPFEYEFVIIKDGISGTHGQRNMFIFEQGYSVKMLFLDLTSAMLIIFLIAFCNEALLRRRERKQQDPHP